MERDRECDCVSKYNRRLKNSDGSTYLGAVNVLDGRNEARFTAASSECENESLFVLHNRQWNVNGVALQSCELIGFV